MVLRLFVPPGEGQHKLVPKRPDPIGANATLQYSVVGSTALAATYTSFASRWGHRVTPSQSISRTALFIRSSAGLGLWAGAVGAAINWYYYTAFVGVVVSERNLKTKPWKLYKWTKRRTVEDGCLAGAALGLAASVPTLFRRRPAIPRWTRCLGMTNIGACTGILGAHGYLQYTGKRQKAYKRLHRRLEQKSLEFWAIFWDKELMAKFNPLIQQYIRHNGIWYTSHLPDSVFEQPVDHTKRHGKSKKSKSNADAPASTIQPEEELPYYTQAFDYAEDLRKINVESTHSKMVEMEAEKEALLREAEYVLFVSAQKEYRYCHTKEMDDDERQRRLQEIMLCQIAYNRIKTAACAIDNKLAQWCMSLQHKAITEAHPAGGDVLESWLPASVTNNYATHDPAIAMQEMEKFRTQIAAEAKQFEQLINDYRNPKERRERWRRDLEDGRTLLKAADWIIWEFEKVQKALEQRDDAVNETGNAKGTQTTTESGRMEAIGSVTKANAATSEQEAMHVEDKKPDKNSVEKENTGKSQGGSLESDKP